MTQASAGARHTVVLADRGDVYGWGDCGQGQLGASERCDSVFMLSRLSLSS